MNSSRPTNPTAIETLVSIVVPVYNAAAFVAETLHSLARQDHAKLEVIIINDGSTDHSLKVIENFLESLPEAKAKMFTLANQENQGQARTLNNGWQKASGEVLGYLSADDLIDSGCISTNLAELLSASNCVGTYPDYRLIDSQSKFIKNVTAPDFDRTRLLLEAQCAPGPGALFWRKELQKIHGWNPSFKQIPDYDFWLRLTRNGDLKRVPMTLASFRIHEESQSFRAPTIDRAEEIVLCLEAFWSQATPADPHAPAVSPVDKNRSLSSAHFLSARSHLRAQRHKLAWHHLLTAIKLYPFHLLSWRCWRFLISGLFGQTFYRLKSFRS